MSSSSAARRSFENPKVHTVSEFMRFLDQAKLPPPEKFQGIIDKVVDKYAGDDWELRRRLIGSARKNLRVLRQASRKQMGDTSSTSSATITNKADEKVKVKADEMETEETNEVKTTTTTP